MVGFTSKAGTSITDTKSLRRKFTNKKHKTWEGDGVLSVFGGYARLQDISGREMGKTMFKDPLLPESRFSVGGKEIEIESILSKAEYLSGKPFINNNGSNPASSSISNSTPKAAFNAPISLPKGKMPLPGRKKRDTGEDSDDSSMEISAKSFYAKSSATNVQFKNPVLNSTILPTKKDGGATPRHSTTAPGALIMKRPNDCPKGKEIVDVVVDPFLSQHLREHQREGVKFLYECVMGLRDFNGQGAVLADEMGLGKTLQTIALIWTLLKQNAIYSPTHTGVIKKALIVCPATLIVNWKKEFQKWLGNERIGVLVLDDPKKTKVTDFTHSKSYSVMIVGYERLRNIQEELQKGGGIDLIIADEGHRLKTAANKSAQAIRALNTTRRVILSGTPIQNDLSEFFIMVDFVNPGVLGHAKTFKKEFEIPIVKSRQPKASANDMEKGTAREEELSSLTKQFILRRTSEILSKYLPPKTEYVLFCRPTQTQVHVYQHVLASPFFNRVLGNSEAAFQLIMLLKKVCNSPSLLVKKPSKDDEATTNSNVAEMLASLPPELLREAPARASGKLRVLDQLLKHLARDTKEKIVIVSNYTSTLDILGQHLASLGLNFLRLDGSTPTARRQDLVDTFNKDPASKTFAFLLSAKSGGAGINLIGASRLVLFDVDWNPAVDLQAMARIHRDGQKRPVKIYRLLVAGGIDEKIYQRQVNKMGLADSVVDGKKNDSSFSPEELRDLFRLDVMAECQTHDLLGCTCRGLGMDMLPSISLLDVPTSSASTVDLAASDEEDFPPLTTVVRGLVKGTKKIMGALRKAEEEEQKKLKAGKMQALMVYRHVDTSILKHGPDDIFSTQMVMDVESVLGDEVLVEVLKEKSCKVGYVFAKKDRTA